MKDKKTKKSQEENETVNAPEVVEETAAEATAPADSVEESQGDSDTSQLLKQLDEVTGQLDEYKNRYLRSVADFENFRKRSLRDKEEARNYATSALIEDIIPALDNMGLGLKSAQDHHPEAKGVIDGINMVFTQLKNVLAQHGVEEVNPAIGDAFDPNVHEGVAHVPSEDVDEGAVMALQRVGYRLRDRLIRPAAVVVSAGAAKE
jgi:molecular chaperone GrpE